MIEKYQNLIDTGKEETIIKENEFYLPLLREFDKRLQIIRRKHPNPYRLD